MANGRTPSRRPLWLGFSLAPLAAPLAYAVWALFFFTDRTPKHELSGFDSYVVSSWALIFAGATGLSYAASILFGTALLSVLRRLEKVSFWWVVVPAALLGAITATACLSLLLTFGASIRGEAWRPLVTFSLVGGASGSIVAIAFCMLVGITSGARGR